ncbi:glycosyltransferase family 4 protein [Asticcacaulis sp. YBE204]|uniref:glycosyltransferase family 4 protein n=1 Tax=Asticcacaulis sp. YBE204 TaxID=1282363 RepID=UPI0003C3C7E9|nr:hypothetical protein [Asticcacaulis sp. YBE204]ESQ80127.1 hypothetical protein AEYBE204_05780 [Asticcacaulis sp. YBE204]
MIEVWIVPPLILFAAFVLSALLAAGFTQLAIRGGPVDIPRDRGAHKAPTPTSGGLAVMAAAGLSLGLLIWLCVPGKSDSVHSGALLFIFASLAGLSGAIDDFMDLPAKARLLFQILLCLGFAWLFPARELVFGPGLALVLPLPVGVIGSALWLVVGLNAINFMDGANGLAIGTQIVCLLIFAGFIVVLGPQTYSGLLMSGVLLVCVTAAGAFTGLLPFNLPLGRVFQGDAGSLFGGALVTGSVLVLNTHEIASVWLGGFLLAPFLVDVILTLIWRAQRKKDLFTAHKDHLYQQWLIHRDPSHFRLALRVWALCALSSAIGVGARILDEALHTDLRFTALCLVIALYTAGWFWVRKRLSA